MSESARANFDPNNVMINCPSCRSIVLASRETCPLCGHSLATSLAQPGLAVSAPTRKSVKLAIVLFAIVAGAIGGYISYDRMWANNPVWNAAIDRPFASNAVDNLSPICIRNGDNTTNPNNPTFWTVLGIRNRSGYSMDTRWTLAFNDPKVNVFVSSTQTFHLAGSGDAYPKFQWSLNATQVAAQRSDPDTVHNLVISLDRTFNVTGYHGSYSFTRHDAGTEAGVHPGFLGATIGGNVGKIIGPPPCPDSTVNS